MRYSIICFLFMLSTALGGNIEIIGGYDTIGPDGSLTNGTGGFSAVFDDIDNLGQPATEIVSTGLEKLTEFRVVLFGVPIENNLRFDNFDYQFEFWKTSDYLSNAPPEFSVKLDSPISLIVIDPNTTIPDISFGNSGHDILYFNI